MPTLTKEQHERLDFLIDKVVAGISSRQELKEACELAEEYTKKLGSHGKS